MSNFIQKFMSSKKEYKAQLARVQALPEDYRFVYQKIEAYMWSFAGGSGMDMLQTQYNLIDLLEAGAAEGRHILELTGEDVATFCDELIQGNTLWTDEIKKRMNRKINAKLNNDSH